MKLHYSCDGKKKSDYFFDGAYYTGLHVVLKNTVSLGFSYCFNRQKSSQTERAKMTTAAILKACSQRESCTLS